LLYLKDDAGFPDALDALSLALCPGVILPLTLPFAVALLLPFFKVPDFCNWLVTIS